MSIEKELTLGTEYLGIQVRMVITSIHEITQQKYMVRGKIFFQQENEWVNIGKQSRMVSKKKLLQLGDNEKV